MFKYIPLSLIFLFVAVPLAYADSSTLAVYPPIIKISAQPPTSLDTTFAIQNKGSRTEDIDIQFKPFTAGPKENGEVSYYSGDPPWINKSFLDEVEVLDDEGKKVTTLSLPSAQQKNLSLHFSIPEEEKASDYYFSIVLITKNNNSDKIKTSSSLIQTAVAIHVLASIGPKEKGTGSIDEFSNPFFLQSGPVPFVVKVKNTGKHVIAPTGSIVIKNIFGQAVGEVPILSLNILSNTTRILPDNKKAPSVSKKCSVTQEVSIQKSDNPLSAIWKETFLLGYYTATLNLALTDKGETITATSHFIGFPILLVIGIFIAIIIILYIRKKVKKQLKSRPQAQKKIHN